MRIFRSSLANNNNKNKKLTHVTKYSRIFPNRNDARVTRKQFN